MIPSKGYTTLGRIALFLFVQTVQAAVPYLAVLSHDDNSFSMNIKNEERDGFHYTVRQYRTRAEQMIKNSLPFILLLLFS